MVEVAPNEVVFLYGGVESTAGNLRVMHLRVTRDPPMLFSAGASPPGQ
eukprot:COSAG01_NODE_8978_length_2600_cov_2.155787_1_plen_48_part_00